MSVRTSGAITVPATDASFRAWIAEIIAALTAAGWVQTTDTGQLNPATITYPTSNNAIQGSMIWRMADALQATAPVFVKFSFGSQDLTTKVNFQVSIGTGSNGAGALTGNNILTADIGIASNAAANDSLYSSGSTNRFAMAMWPAVDAARSIFFSIERSKDAGGNDTTDGVIFASRSGSSWAGSGSWIANLCNYNFMPTYTGSVAGSLTQRQAHDGAPVFIHGNLGAQGAVGPHTPVWPWRYTSQRGAENEPMNILSYNNTLVVGNLAEFDAEMYGANRHYKGFTTVTDAGWVGSNVGASPLAKSAVASIALRWE